MEAGVPLACEPLISKTQVRPVVKFRTDIWRNRLDSVSSNQKELEWYNKEVELLKEKVETMLMDKSSDAVQRIKLIDLLCRLALSYHFQAEIEKQLHHIFTSQPDLLDTRDYDLFTVAVVFRVFRQHGFKMSCGIFNKFKDGEKGKFTESLANDPKGLLSLYEAAHLCTHGEDILEEALAFTTTHLKLLAHCKPNLANEINSSLMIPLHKAPPRLKAKEFIFFYENRVEDYDEPPNDMLLKFAKLDFNRLQLLHNQEIMSIYKWSKDQDLQTKIPFARDRIMEFFFWAESLYFEPQYTYARAEYIKQCNLVTFLDDTYDTYGAFDELRILTDVMKSWNRDMIDRLPRDYMKHLYQAYLDSFEELEKQVPPVAVSLTKDYLMEFVRLYMMEVEWIKSGYIPPFEESLEIGIISAGERFMQAIAFIGMGELTVQGFQWLKNGPKLAKAACTIARLANELVSHKRDDESENFTYPFNCYKKEYMASDEEAVIEFRRRITSAWKTLNEELMRDSANVPLEILMRVVNYARLMEVFYKDGDGVTDGREAENYIKTMYFDPIPL